MMRQHGSSSGSLNWQGHKLHRPFDLWPTAMCKAAPALGAAPDPELDTASS